MINNLKSKSKKAQTAIEYLLLLAVTAIIVFISFKTLLPKSGEISQAYFNKTAAGIMGDAPGGGCVPNGSCSAPNPACGTTTTGVDNCGNPCSKTGPPCPSCAGVNCSSRSAANCCADTCCDVHKITIGSIPTTKCGSLCHPIGCGICFDSPIP